MALEERYKIQYNVDGGTWIDVGFTSLGARSIPLNIPSGLSGNEVIKSRIRKEGPDGIGDWLEEVTGVTFQVAPAQPGSPAISQLSATETAGTFRATWGNVSFEDGFEVEYRVNGGTWTAATGSPVAADVLLLDFAVTLNDGDTIQQRVRATNDIYFSTWATSSTVVADLIPIAPSSVVLSQIGADTTKITARLVWVDNANNETGFDVEYRVELGAWTPASGGTGLPANTITHDFPVTIIEGDNVRGRVKATGAIGDSAFIESNDITGALDPIAPTVGTLVQTGNTTTTITVNLPWTDNSNNELGFDVQYDIDGAGFLDAPGSPAAANATSHPFTITVGEGNIVTARVRSTNAQDQSAYQVSNTIVADVITIPAAPTATTFVNVSDASDNVTLSWTDNSNDEDGFDIEFRINGGSWFSAGGASADIEFSTFDPYTLQGALNGNTLDARVRSTNDAGDSAWSTLTGLTYTHAPIQVTGVVASQGKDATFMTVIWDEHEDEDNYEVEYKINAGSFIGFAGNLYASGQTSAADTDGTIVPTDTITIQVRAINSSGNGTYASDSYVTT